MAQRKTRAITIGCTLLALALLVGGTVSAGDTWTTLTSFKTVRDLAVIDDTLYAATPGGLLLVADSASPGRAYLHTDGLGTNDLRDIMVDEGGTIWLAGFGRLIRFDPGAPRQFLFVDRDGLALPLHALADDGDNLWVGAEGWLVRFSKVHDGGQIEYSYFRFGELRPSPVVHDIALRQDSIWIATSSGLAVAATDNPLQPVWTTFDATRYPELGTDSIRVVELFDGDIYVATSEGAFRFSAGSPDTSFVPIPFAFGQAVTDLVAEGDSLFVYYSGGIGVVTAADTVVLGTTGLSLPATTGIGWDGRRWVGMGDSGLFVGSGGTYSEYRFTGAPGNDVRTVAFDPVAGITAGFGDKVYAQYDGEEWAMRITYARNEGTRDLLVDPVGDVWAGGWGGGLWQIEGESIYRYTDTNSTCATIFDPSHPEYWKQYTVVRSLATDGVNIFASLFQAWNGDVVAWAPLDQVHNPFAWGALGAAEGLTNDEVTVIGYGRGQLAVGTNQGVYLCELGSEPYNGTSPRVTYYTDDNSRLISNAVRSIAYAPNGEVWVGTNLGISRWDSGIERFVDMVLPVQVGTDIRSIAFDGRGNAWVGTLGGVARLDATGGLAEWFTVDNSALVSDDVRDLWLDRPRGDLYMATAGGISVLRTQIDNYVEAIDSVAPIPNPFVIRTGSERLRFNLDRPAVVSIFTVAGDRVVEFPVNEPWDGRNERGRAVASGAYIYVITDETGAVHRGKILLVRRQ